MHISPDGLTDVYLFPGDKDGRLHALHSDGGGGKFNSDHVLHSAWQHDVVTQIENGHGLTKKFVYKPLTDPTVYTKGKWPEQHWAPLPENPTEPHRVVDVISSQRVVAEVHAENGQAKYDANWNVIGSDYNVQKYHYTGLRSHPLYGNLGFSRMKVTDVPTGIVTVTDYSQAYDWKHFGLLTRTRTIRSDATQGNGCVTSSFKDWTPKPDWEPASGTVLSEKVAFWRTHDFSQDAPNQRWFTYNPEIVTKSCELNGALMSTVSERTTYETNLFFPTAIISDTTGQAGDRHVKTTTNVYSHDLANWKLGKLVEASVKHESPNVSPITRKSSFSYMANGSLWTENIEPGTPLHTTKIYAYGGRGEVKSITEAWGSYETSAVLAPSGVPTNQRTSSFEYDPQARYRIKETNPLGHSQTTKYHPVFGQPTEKTGPNGLTTYWYYDGHGRQTLEWRPDSTYTYTTLVWHGSPSTTYAVWSSPSTGSSSAQYFDKLNRNYMGWQLAGDANSYEWIVKHWDYYDSQGRTIWKTSPYKPGPETPQWTRIDYDLIGRVIQTVGPQMIGTTWATESVAYNGSTKISTNYRGQKKTVTVDGLGRPETVVENNPTDTTVGATITYNYDAIGQTTSLVSSAGTTSSYEYNERGFKIRDTDPDKGTWRYEYNALGMITKQTDAKGQVTLTTYDLLGRPLKRIDDAFGANPTLRESTWSYDNGVKATGKMTAATSLGYRVDTTYDNLGRPAAVTELIGAQSFTTSTSYDAQSRPLVVTYPSGLRVQTVYDATSGVKEIRNADTGMPYFERLAFDGRGNVTKSKLGNGVKTDRVFDAASGHITDIRTANSGGYWVQNLTYTFDAIGNLTKREDKLLNQYESFAYDGLNRVITVQTQPSPLVAGGQMPALKTDTVTYDARGNITSRSDVGTYSYGTANAACGSVGGAIAMAGPHAVAAIAGLKTAGYCYDANGNTIRGDGRSISYTASDMVASVQRGSNIVSFDYGPDRKRFRRVDVTGGTSSTTLYVAGGAMEVITRATRTDTRHYIGDFAVVTTSASQGTSQTTTQYLHRDHLGSVDTITNASGAVVQRMSFDAWGKRRETNWLTMSDGAIAAFDTSATTNRGFTGHEMIDPVGLVHMNGRVYDPEIGRFLSADPHVQEVDNHQNWNRYSYVLNNPLSYTDPTGYFFKKLFGKSGSSGSFWKKLGNLLKAVLKFAIKAVACAVNAFVCAAASGMMTLMEGGSLKQALKAAAFAFISAGIFDHIGPSMHALVKAHGFAGALIKSGIHGIIGGALNVAQGGSFLQGFAASALGALGGFFAGEIVGNDISMKFARTAIAAAFGCAGAAVSGGKCAEGALSAAIAHLYNQEGPKADREQFEACKLSKLCMEHWTAQRGREFNNAMTWNQWFRTSVSTLLVWSPGGDSLFNPEPGFRIIIATSSPYLTDGQRDIQIQPEEHVANSEIKERMHAEMRALAYADKHGLIPVMIWINREPCPSCAPELVKRGLLKRILR